MGCSIYLRVARLIRSVWLLPSGGLMVASCNLQNGIRALNIARLASLRQLSLSEHHLFSSDMPIQARPALEAVRRVLADRAFSNFQIEKLLPRLHDGHKSQPEALAEIIDCWNDIMVSSAPANSVTGKQKLNMNTILADIEPDLLLLSPDKLIQRHKNLQGLGILNNIGENWTILFNAPRGFYLQDWLDLSKKVLYIDRKVVDLLYDKKEQRAMDMHPIVKSAASVETSFDHIRTRYLFAERTGYAELSHMRTVQTAANRPILKDMFLSEDEAYLKKFAPFCSVEEFSCFSNLIKNHDIDEDDADLFSRIAELDSVRHPFTNKSPMLDTRALDRKEDDYD